LYGHIRPYLMGLAMSETTKDDTKWTPEVVILRDDDKVAVVKEGKLKLHSSDNWIKIGQKRKARREQVTGKKSVLDLAGVLTPREATDFRSDVRTIRSRNKRRIGRKH